MKDLDFFDSLKKNKKKTEKTNNEVWLYTRVSSKEQFQSNSSIQNQKKAAEELARKKGFVITNIFGETYESAKDDFTRKEFSNLIERVKKSNKKPFAIMIYKMSRFSRSGGQANGIVHELIHVHKVHLIEVETEKDTTTADGESNILEELLRAKKENTARMAFTLPGMKTFLSNGKWLGRAPRGYVQKGPRVNNEKNLTRTQRIEISEEGRHLQQAWKLKLRCTPDKEIIEYLKKMGVDVSKQFLSRMWRNPFYCGVLKNELLEHSILGNWEPMVTINEFKVISKRLKSIDKVLHSPKDAALARPLQGYLYCGICNTKMTGYQVRNQYHYYKCQSKTCTCKDLNAKSSKKSLKAGLHDSFSDLLNSIHLSKGLESVFKEQLRLTILSEENESIIHVNSLHQQLKVLQGKFSTIQKKYVFDEITSDLFNEYGAPLKSQIAELEQMIEKHSEKISNLEDKIDKLVEMAKNLNKMWLKGGLDTKISIQNLVFPDGIFVDPEKRTYRTKNMAKIFDLMSSLSGDYSEKTKKTKGHLALSSHLVAGTGLEPVTFGL